MSNLASEVYSYLVQKVKLGLSTDISLMLKKI